MDRKSYLSADLFFIKFKHIALVCVDQCCIVVFADAGSTQIIVEMNMTMNMVRGFILVHQMHEGIEPCVRRSVQISVSPGRSMGEQNIKSLMVHQFRPEFSTASFHLGLCLLMCSVAVFSGATQAQDAHTIVHVNLIFYINAS